MTKINYVIGDATYPEGDGHKILAHVCNDIGKWGSGFVLALNKRWSAPKDRYLHGQRYWLGMVEFVQVEEDITVANIIGQDGVQRHGYKRPVRYDAISDGLDDIFVKAQELSASVHMPRMGAGLAGGDWRIIEALVEESLCDRGIPVTVYDLTVGALTATTPDRSMRHR